MLYMFLAVPAAPAARGMSMPGHASAFSVLALLMADTGGTGTYQSGGFPT